MNRKTHKAVLPVLGFMLGAGLAAMLLPWALAAAGVVVIVKLFSKERT